MSEIKDQPPPKMNRSRPIWELVVQDMYDRDRTGRERYGVPLQANNGRDGLVDAYQEALDLTVYLRQVIEEEVVASHGVQKLGVKLLEALDMCQREARLNADFPAARQEWETRAVAYRDVQKWVKEFFPHAFAR